MYRFVWPFAYERFAKANNTKLPQKSMGLQLIRKLTYSWTDQIANALISIVI